MRNRRFTIVNACLASLVAVGCGNEKPVSDTQSRPTSRGAEKVVEDKVLPYTYAAPVKGHIKQIREVNIAAFDLVDGIAYTALAEGGTVVYVASKPIASPMLADSACPLSQARALSKLRDASYGEVTLDAEGRSNYFAAGTPFGGSLTDFTLRGWSSTLKTAAGRAAGSATHGQYGRFEFDLPLSNPKFEETSYGDREQKRRLAVARWRNFEIEARPIEHPDRSGAGLSIANRGSCEWHGVDFW